MSTKNKGGRPSKFTQAILDELCERMSKGEPEAVICRDEHMPAARTVRDWKMTLPEVTAAIACAREAGEDSIAADCLLIADTPMEGVIEEYERKPVKKPDGTETVELVLIKRRVEDMLGHRRLKIETRLKLLAKWNPKKWGERLQHANDPESPMPAPQFIVQPVAPKGE